MPVTDNYTRLPISSIAIRRDERQRSKLDTKDLEASIKQIGLINPIIVRREQDIDGSSINVLVAGERRIIACKNVGFTTISVRFAEDLSRRESSIIELEENIKRIDIHWQDLVRAVYKIHSLHREEDPDWTQGETAYSLSISTSKMSECMKVFSYLNDPRISECNSVREAINVIERREHRQRSDTIADILGAPPVTIEQTTESDEDSLDVNLSNVQIPKAPNVVIRDAVKDILNVSFLDWAPKYKGRKYNFIHCDFPFGVGFAEGPQGRGSEHTPYEDSPEIYSALLRCFVDNLDRFTSHSAHLMFWYSEKLLQETKEILSRTDFEWNTHPLIWLHSDNTGISPDAARYPRHIYDTCLLGTRGGRRIVKSVGDAYSAPTDHKLHPSTKPVPMLRHFFAMLVDEYSDVFDPTCGSGSALRAAESLGARRVLGIESRWDYAESARRALKDARILKLYSGTLA